MTVEKFYTQANSILNELKIVNDSLLDNDFFISLITKEYISGEEANTITATINSQLSKSAYVQDTFVVSREHDAVYTNHAHFSYNSLSSLLETVDISLDPNHSFSEDDLKEGWSVPNNSYSSPYYVSYIKDGTGQKRATLIVVLAKGYLYKSLFITNSTFCCMFNDNFLITSNFKSDPSVDYTSETAVSKLVGKSVKIFSIENGGYTYVTALSRENFYRPLFIILLAFGIYIAIILIFSMVHIYTVNKREKAFFSSLVSELPQPIAGDPDIQTIFTSIQEALEDYKEEHSAFSEQSKFRDLDRLAQGYLGNTIEDRQLEDMNIDTAASSYYMLRFALTETGILNPSHRTDLLCIIIETALNGFSQDRYKAVCFPQRNNDVCCILNVYDESLDHSSIHEAVRHLKTMLEKDYGTIFTCTLSSPVHYYTDIPQTWQETIDLFRFVHAIDSSARFISAEELADSPGFLIMGEFLKQLQVLSSTLLLGKYDMIPQMIDSMMEEHIAPLRKDYDLIQNRLQCIITLLLETPLPEYIGIEEADRIHAELKSVDSISELSSVVHSCFDTLMADREDMAPVNRACDFIHDQIANINLSVPEVAEYAGLSVQHLSKLFKAEKGMTMVEYINQYRINLSQELLMNTDHNVTEIAEQTGYANNVTFTRNFKRYVGCTPSEYRQKNR